jgi:outer membrane biosynthesis protein TonB
MIERVIGPIVTTGDLKKLQARAVDPETIALGISNSGIIYKLVNGTANKVPTAEAAEILDVSPEDIQEIVKAKGAYTFQEKQDDQPLEEEQPIEEEHQAAEKEEIPVHVDKEEKEEIEEPQEQPVQSTEKDVHEEQPIEEKPEEKQELPEEVEIEIKNEEIIEFLDKVDQCQKDLQIISNFLEKLKK